MRRRGLAFLPLLAVLALPLAACTENTGRGAAVGAAGGAAIGALGGGSVVGGAARGAAAGAAGGFIYDTIFR
jgi:osmotically inducible lipoprotein OsmB